jgi:hypothetical protein
LTCRVRITGLTVDQAGDYLVLVILAASSESTCAAANDCMLTLASPTAEITSLSAEFNPATNNIEVTATGSGFPVGNPDAVSLFVDGRLQVTTSVDSSSNMVFTIHDAGSDSTL